MLGDCLEVIAERTRENPTVYIETSVIGYLASRPSRDLIVAANQQITRDWWDNHRRRFDVFISDPVVDECSTGDPVAAQERLVFLAGMTRLKLVDDARTLAASLIAGVPLPSKAQVDASISRFRLSTEWTTC